MKRMISNLRKAVRDRGLHLRGRGLRARRGSATLELALTGVLLCTICFGAVEGGWYFYAKNMMEGAAREGCRTGIVSGATASGVNNVIEYQLQIAGLVGSGTTATGSGPYSIGNYTVTYADYNGSTQTTITDPSNCTVGDDFIVTITANWGTIGKNFRPMQLIGSSKTLTTTSMMRKEG